MAATPGGYVLVSRGDVYSLDNNGRQSWHRSLSEDAQVVVAATTVIVSSKNPLRTEWPGSLIVKAFDITSGTELWSDDRPSFVSVLATAVYTSLCHGGQNNRIGDCHLSARDPRTGKTRWTIATYASSSVDVEPADPLAMDTNNAPSVSPYLVIISYPTGLASQTFTAVDSTSGRPLGISFKADGVIVTGNFLMQWNDEQNRTGSGCTTTFAARNTRSAATIWRRSFTDPVDADGKCQGIQSEDSGDALALADSTGRTQVLDLATGKIDWTAVEPGPPVLMTNDVVVIANADGGVTTFDRRTGRTRWQTAGPSHPDSLQPSIQARVLGRWLAVFDINAGTYCSSVCPTVSVLDLQSGSQYRAVPGRLITTTSGIVVTETDAVSGSGWDSDYRAYAIQ